MIHSTPFEASPDLGITRTVHFDDETGEAVIQTTQNVEGMLDSLAFRRNLYDERTPWKGDLHHVGTIPDNEFHALRERYRDRGTGRVDWEALSVACLKWIESHNKFKARPGRLL